jgi:hypothetical protein
MSERARVYTWCRFDVPVSEVSYELDLKTSRRGSCRSPRMEQRAKLGLRPDQSLNSNNPRQKKVCDDLRAKNAPLIEEGIESLNRAIELRPDYGDAMAYINLMYREKADLDCDDPIARTADLRTADEWVDKTMATKKAKAQERSEPTGPVH